MSSNPKLATLLQYRFVKKPLEKIQNDQESINGEGSQKSTDDSQATINGDAPPSLNSEMSTPSINGDSLSTVPETPEVPSSPSSPVFQQKSKFIRKNVIESDEEVPSSGEWLSKDKGINEQSSKPSTKRKQKIEVREEYRDESEDEDELDGPQTDKVRQIRDMFPSASTKDIVMVLRNKNWKTEEAIDVFISGRAYEYTAPSTKSKKKRVIRCDSSDSELPDSAPPKKRVRRVESSDSEDMDSQATVSYSQTADSQATIDYNLNSQKSLDEKDKIKFLADAYPEKNQEGSKEASV